MMILNKFSVLKVFLFVVTAALFYPGSSLSEFYQYVNKDGVVCFTDDYSEVEANKRKEVQIHKGKYDGLSSEERQRLLEQESEEIEKIKKATQETLNNYDEIERLEAMEKERKRLASITTPFDMIHNSVLVPVTIGYNNTEVSVKLILDTGAYITTVNQHVAKQLDVTDMDSTSKKQIG